MSITNVLPSVNLQIKTPGANHERIPARRLHQLESQILAERKAEMVEHGAVENLAWIKKIERRRTSNDYPLWVCHGDKIFHLSNFDTGLALLRESGLDLDHMLMFETLPVEILVEWQMVTARRDGLGPDRRQALDARKPAITRVVKIQRADKSLYDQVADLMVTAGYRGQSELTSSPTYVVEKAVGTLFPYLDRPAELLAEVQLWLAKWQAAHPAPSAPEIDPILIALREAGDALDSWDLDILPADDRRAYFGWLLEVTRGLPLTIVRGLTAACAGAAGASVKSRPETKLLPAPKPQLLLPAWTDSTIRWYEAVVREALKSPRYTWPYHPQACASLVVATPRFPVFLRPARPIFLTRRTARCLA